MGRLLQRVALEEGMLELLGPVIDEDGFHLYEAIDCSVDPPIYSCVYLYTGNMEPGWPALGGTRWVRRKFSEFADITEYTRNTARELAISMTIKNSILRSADRKEGARGLFQWNGGKGVIWSPEDTLTPYRLMCHGRLIEHIGGHYIGSKDQGVGTSQLRWIEKATKYTIGLGCGKDTGEGTAAGTVAGIWRSAIEEKLIEDSKLDPSALLVNAPGGLNVLRNNLFTGLSILVVGAGKVGLPLLKFLRDLGAELYVYDPMLNKLGVYEFHRYLRRLGAAITDEHLHILEALGNVGRLYQDEETALNSGTYNVLSPNGGPTEWLGLPMRDVEDQRVRAEILADSRRKGGKLQLIVGAGNDQLPATAGKQAQRDVALAALDDAGVIFVPDPIVSPGGVVAVSHELAESWDAAEVIRDSTRLVNRSVLDCYGLARKSGTLSSSTMYAAFKQISGVK
jgi:glutamate dehydrogenase/leucine dehydrogenase